MTSQWARDAIVYHLFPLGALGAPAVNGPEASGDRIPKLYDWLAYIGRLGADTIQLGPVLESGTHGYDTTDLFRIDRRLGDTEAFAAWCAEAKRRGFRLVLDGVFHHVGRGFWAFQDVLHHGASSQYADWFHLDFGRDNDRGDGFAYEGWNGHDDLVKLNTSNDAVRRHLFDAVRFWVESFGIDGLRLDAADVLDLDFQRELAAFCRDLRPDFWLMGEVIHGDYRKWVGEGLLDSATNYEVYKGLYSSHNDANYFEIAYSLERQFGDGGIYADLELTTFADNHDVARIASQLNDPRHLYPLHLLLFTVPGIPTIYYGSERGIAGEKQPQSDASLRPALDPQTPDQWGGQPALADLVSQMIDIRRRHGVLRSGGYRPLHVDHKQLVYMREQGNERVIVAVNAADTPATLDIALAEPDRDYADVLNKGHGATQRNGRLHVTLDPNWGRILV